MVNSKAKDPKIYGLRQVAVPCSCGGRTLWELQDTRDHVIVSGEMAYMVWTGSEFRWLCKRCTREMGLLW